MTEEQKVECVKKGYKDNPPTEQDIRQQLWGPDGVKRTKTEQLVYLDSVLGDALNGKGRAVLDIINRIPSGSLISYGNLARWVNQEHGTNLGALNVSWFRRRIYWAIGHDTDIPIHRIASEGVVDSTGDDPVTRVFNCVKRGEEGFLGWLRK